jgi:hypothetical protein
MVRSRREFGAKVRTSTIVSVAFGRPPESVQRHQLISGDAQQSQVKTKILHGQISAVRRTPSRLVMAQPHSDARDRHCRSQALARVTSPPESSLVLRLVVSKQLQVDGIRQCVVSQVVWVPVVSAVVESTDLGRGSGIT